MKIVIAERISDAGVAVLARSATVVTADTPERLRTEMLDADALIVRSGTKVDETLIDAAPNLKVIGRAGIGVDNIDIDAATDAGVLVVNAPQANTVSAAEHTMALLLAQARHIPAADASMRDRRWERARFQGVELWGKTLGIIGLGRIGTLVARRAAAFGMHVVAYDPYVVADKVAHLGVTLAPLEGVLAESDWISIHLPRTPDTAGLIGADEFAAMKPGVRIVNTSRGGIIDEAALVDAIRSGRVAGAALDVYGEEPLTDSPLFDLPQVVLTPHLGASTREAQDRAGVDVAEAVLAALRGGLVTSAVNVDIDPDLPEEVQRFLPLAEQLGTMLVRLVGGLPPRITVQVEGRLAPYPVRPLRLAVLKGALSVATDRTVGYVNAAALAEERGVGVTEASVDESPAYVSLLRVAGESERDVQVAGTIKRGVPVVTGIYDYALELPLAPHMLVVRNADLPGMIGRVGTYLGGQRINISDMVLGRSRSVPGTALMALSLDRALTPTELDDVRHLEGVDEAFGVDLDV